MSGVADGVWLPFCRTVDRERTGNVCCRVCCIEIECYLRDCMYTPEEASSDREMK